MGMQSWTTFYMEVSLYTWMSGTGKFVHFTSVVLASSLRGPTPSNEDLASAGAAEVAVVTLILLYLTASSSCGG